MKKSVILCIVLIIYAFIICSKALSDDEEDSSEGIENVRRKFSSCEPCGLLRRSCCFPSLCRHLPGKISECSKPGLRSY